MRLRTLVLAALCLFPLEAAAIFSAQRGAVFSGGSNSGSTGGGPPGGGGQGGNIYISNTAANGIPVGNDAGNGSITAPYLTVDKAMSVANAGASIICNDGTYTPATFLTITKNLTINPVTALGCTLSSQTGQAKAILITPPSSGSVSFGSIIIDAHNNASAAIEVEDQASAVQLTMAGTKLLNPVNYGVYGSGTATRVRATISNLNVTGATTKSAIYLPAMAFGEINITSPVFSISGNVPAANIGLIHVSATAPGSTFSATNVTSTITSTSVLAAYIRTVYVENIPNALISGGTISMTAASANVNCDIAAVSFNPTIPVISANPIIENIVGTHDCAGGGHGIMVGIDGDPGVSLRNYVNGGIIRNNIITGSAASQAATIHGMLCGWQTGCTVSRNRMDLTNLAYVIKGMTGAVIDSNIDTRTTGKSFYQKGGSASKFIHNSSYQASTYRPFAFYFGDDAEQGPATAGVIKGNAVNHIDATSSGTFVYNTSLSDTPTASYNDYYAVHPRTYPWVKGATNIATLAAWQATEPTAIGNNPSFDTAVVSLPLKVESSVVAKVPADASAVLDYSGLPYKSPSAMGASETIYTPQLVFDATTETSLPAWITLTRASVGSYIDGSGYVVSAATDAIRLMHNPATPFAQRGLLLEPAATNIFLQSELAATWAATATTIGGTTTTGPDGVAASARSVVEGVGGTNHEIHQTVAVTSGTTYTASAWVKKIGSDAWFQIRLPSAQFGGVTTVVNYNLDTCAIGTLGVNATGSGCIQYPNGWVRMWVSSPATATGSPSIILFVEAANNTPSHSGDGTSGAYVWCTQFEADATPPKGPSSCIHTTTATVTRAADVPALAGVGVTYAAAGPSSYFAFDPNTQSSADAGFTPGTFAWPTIRDVVSNVTIYYTTAPPVPVNTVLPVISGIAQTGQTLTSTTGTWTSSPISYAYQWKREGVSIGGATASTYVPVTADVGSAITVSVTAGNGNIPSAPATSAATYKVATFLAYLSNTGSDAAAGTSGAPVQTVSKALRLCETEVFAASPAATYCRFVYLSDQYSLPSGLTSQRYVSTTGNDTNPGTIGSPYRTLQTAFDNAVPGQEIILRGGTYDSPAGGIYASSGGTLTNPISVHNYIGERAILDGAGVSPNTDMLVIRGPYVYVQGLEIANNAGGAGIVLYNGSNNSLYNNYIHDNYQHGVAVYLDTGTFSGQTAIGNVLYKNNKNNSGGPAVWGSAIGGAQSNSWTIKRNIVTQNWGEGIGVYSSSNDVIDNNIVGDNFAGEIYSNNAGGRTITNNYIFNNNLTSYQLDNGDAPDMIAFSRESAAPASIALNNETVSGNIADGGERGLSYFNSGTAGGITNSTFTDNIFANAATADISIESDAGTTGNVLNTNTFYDTSGAMVSGSSTGFTKTNNIWYSGSSGAFAGSGDTSSNPIAGGTPTPVLSLVVSGLGSDIGEISMKGGALLMLHTPTPGTCPKGTGTADGCSGGVAGTPNNPTLLSAYGANRPAWNVAGVDYKVGHSGTLSNPATGGVLPACATYSTGAQNTVTVNSSPCTLDHLDFSLNNGVCLNVAATFGQLTVTNNNFKAGSSCQPAGGGLISIPGGSAVSATIRYNTFDVDYNNNFSNILNLAANGNRTVEYNVFLHADQHDVAFQGSGAYVVRYNYAFGTGCCGNHGDWFIFNNAPGTTFSLNEAFNTVSQDPTVAGAGAGATALCYMATFGGLTLTSATCNNNTYISQLGNDGLSHVSYPIRVEPAGTWSPGPFEVKNNWVRSDGSIDWIQGTSAGGPATIACTGNKDLLTGSTRTGTFGGFFTCN